MSLELRDVWGRPGHAPGEFRQPGGLSVDFRGNLYVADTGNSRVQLFSPEGELVAVVGSAGSGRRRFDRPADVCAELSFHLFVTDSENERIQEFDHLGSFLGFLPAGEGALSCPWGIALGPDGRLYVADREDHRVVVMGPDGSLEETLGGLGGGPAQLMNPTFLVVDDSHRVIVADTGNDRLQLFDAHGGYLESWEATEEGEEFRLPQGVTVGSRSEIYLADAGHARILVLDGRGRILGGAGRGWGDDRGPVFPSGVALGPANRLYVADAEGDRILLYRVVYEEESR